MSAKGPVIDRPWSFSAWVKRLCKVRGEAKGWVNWKGRGVKCWSRVCLCLSIMCETKRVNADARKSSSRKECGVSHRDLPSVNQRTLMIRWYYSQILKVCKPGVLRHIPALSLHRCINMSLLADSQRLTSAYTEMTTEDEARRNVFAQAGKGLEG